MKGRQMVIVESAGITDVGRKRKGNEDSLFLNEELGLYIVADGMGGHQAGEIASSLVVKTIRNYIRQFRENEDEAELIYSDQSLSREANQLFSSVLLSNQVVHQSAQSKPVYRGMGSTVSAIYLTSDTLIVINVGDSPIYLIRNDDIETLSVPHTVVAEQMALNPGEPPKFGKAFSHMLTRAMGIEKDVKPDICEVQCFKNDLLVISSDGLSDKVSPKEILSAAKGKAPGKSCQLLVDMANERGGDDNITVIVLRVKAVRQKKSGITKILDFFRR